MTAHTLELYVHLGALCCLHWWRNKELQLHGGVKLNTFSSCYREGAETQNASVIFLSPTGACNRAGIPTCFPDFKASAPICSAAFTLNAPWTPALILQALLGHVGIHRSPLAHVATELWTTWSWMQQLYKTHHLVMVKRPNKNFRGKKKLYKDFCEVFAVQLHREGLQVSCKCSALLFFPNCKKLSILNLF